MLASSPQFVLRASPSSCGLSNAPQNVHHRRMAEADKQYVEIGNRLAAVRQSFSELNKKDWAEKNGFNTTQYGNWETGLRRIPVESAEKLCNLYGLTLDFIYRGRRDGLSERASKSL